MKETAAADPIEVNGSDGQSGIGSCSCYSGRIPPGVFTGATRMLLSAHRSIYCVTDKTFLLLPVHQFANGSPNVRALKTWARWSNYIMEWVRGEGARRLLLPLSLLRQPTVCILPQSEIGSALVRLSIAESPHFPAQPRVGLPEPYRRKSKLDYKFREYVMCASRFSFVTVATQPDCYNFDLDEIHFLVELELEATCDNNSGSDISCLTRDVIATCCIVLTEVGPDIGARPGAAYSATARPSRQAIPGPTDTSPGISGHFQVPTFFFNETPPPPSSIHVGRRGLGPLAHCSHTTFTHSSHLYIITVCHGSASDRRTRLDMPGNSRVTPKSPPSDSPTACPYLAQIRTDPVSPSQCPGAGLRQLSRSFLQLVLAKAIVSPVTG
ncbi:hypothetical protein J6590_022291 [Homalodisca vitripennis]|nr:hypothetical protein J6590_022291 [Homalodisca vitripennis]